MGLSFSASLIPTPWNVTYALLTRWGADITSHASAFRVFSVLRVVAPVVVPVTAHGLFHSIVPGAAYSDKDAKPAEERTINTVVDTVRTKR